MSCSIRVFSSKSGSKGVDITHRTGVVFSGELATDCKKSRFFEKIFGVVYNFRGLVLGDVVNCFFLFGENSGDLEHGSCAFAVTGRDQRSAYVYEPPVLVEQMRRQENRISDPHHRTNQISSRAQMRDFTQSLRLVVLFRQRVRFLVALSKYLHEVQFVIVT